MTVATASFTPDALAYFETHAIRPAVALGAGVSERAGCLVYPYRDDEGTYERSRSLSQADGKTQQPRGRALGCWWPMGRPERATSVLVCEGESDALAAASALDGDVAHPIANEILQGLAVIGVPGASFPTNRLVTELRSVDARRVILAADGDEAGDGLASRTTAALAADDIEVSRLSLSRGSDLADHLAAAGAARTWLAEAIADAQEPQVEVPDAVAGRVIVAESFASIRTERTSWLWAGRIPLKAPTLLVGREKLGKSTLTVALAAGVSRGTLDGDLYGQPSSVLMLSYEDSASSTVKPRLLAAGADPACVYQASARREGIRDLVSLPDDVEEIGMVVREHRCRLVIVDPFSASLGADINSHRDQDMRRAIASLAQLAESEDAALLLVAHFNKAATGDSLTRVLGSRGLTAAARSVLVFGKAPDAEDGSPDRVLAHAACNLAAEVPSLACRIEPRVIDVETGTMETSRLAMLGDCETHADDLLATRGEEERSDRDAAADWLADELSDGEWHLAREIKAHAKADGVAERTLQRARVQLGVEDRREGFPAVGEWRLAAVPMGSGTAVMPANGTAAQTRMPEPDNAHTADQPCQTQSNGTTVDPDGEMERLAAKFETCGCVDPLASETGDCAKCGRPFT